MQHYLPQSYLLQNRYRISRKIGQGGFGITYEAIDQELEKKVCIKELYIEGINQRAGEQVTLTETKKEFSWTYFIGNFKREAQKIAEFRHSNIVSVSSVFEANGTAYYVMEYVEGENLKEYLTRLGRPFTEQEIKPIAAQIFDAVDTVHSKGLLHRDIKPDNFLITNDKQIVLIDFGSSRENMDEKTVALLSSTTILMLTHGYSAPEMYSNLSVKGRYTDIYSLGATLYYLLCQKKPMPANDRQFAKMPALHEVNPNVSTQLSSAVMMAMEMKEEDRFQSVGDFRLALQQMAGGQKKKEEQKTVVIPKTEKVKKESPKTAQNPERGKKNNNVLIFSVIGGVVLILILLFVFNPFGTALQSTADAKSSLDIEMIAVAGGTFTMGCTAEQGADCGTDEKPAHQVTLSDYKIGKYEVTQAQWKAVMGNNPSNFSGCDKCPVDNVSWNDVQEFIIKLNEKTGKTYRLPTEAEWEFAARGGKNSNKSKYSGSNILDEVAWHDGTSGGKTHEVGTKAANDLGIYDMSGNVWEWCQDRYGDYDASSKTNPKGASSGSKRVLRGGSWDCNPQNCRVSNRHNNGAPDFRDSTRGFRLVLAP